MYIFACNVANASTGCERVKYDVKKISKNIYFGYFHEKKNIEKKYFIL